MTKSTKNFIQLGIGTVLFGGANLLLKDCRDAIAANIELRKQEKYSEELMDVLEERKENVVVI